MFLDFVHIVPVRRIFYNSSTRIIVGEEDSDLELVYIRAKKFMCVFTLEIRNRTKERMLTQGK